MSWRSWSRLYFRVHFWFGLVLQELALDYYFGLDLVFLPLVLLGYEDQLLFNGLGERGRGQRRRGRLGLLVVHTEKVLIEQALSVFAAALVADVHGQPELEVERADLADVFVLAAGQADAGALVDSLVALPLEDSEGPEADAALLSEVLLQHAQVGVFPVALVAPHWEL